MTPFLAAAQLLGGIGLFVLGISMISDGFRLAAGEGLRGLLGRWTNSLGRGMVAGAGLTAVAQSSSAVTIATIGFVNAGLISLNQSLGIVYGANIGTTMTGWLISVVGRPSLSMVTIIIQRRTVLHLRYAHFITLISS